MVRITAAISDRDRMSFSWKDGIFLSYNQVIQPCHDLTESKKNIFFKVNAGNEEAGERIVICEIRELPPVF